MPKIDDMNTAETTRLGIATEIRAQMGRKRVSANVLARKVGMSSGALSERLSGKRAFNTDQLAKVTAVLDMDLLALFVAAESSGAASGSAA